MPDRSRATPHRLVSTLPALALLGALARPAAAQPAPSGDSARTDPLCWRGRPLPRCRSFILFELGYHAPAIGTTFRERLPEGGGFGSVERRERDFSNQFAWSAGVMRNRDARTALGASVLLGGTGRGDVIGLQARYRQWTGPRSSAEVGVGPIGIKLPESILVTSPAPTNRHRLGVAVDGRLNFADRVAGGVRVVAVPTDGRVRGAVLAGGNVGSGVAVAGTILTGLALGALILALLSSGYD